MVGNSEESMAKVLGCMGTVMVVGKETGVKIYLSKVLEHSRAGRQRERRSGRR